MSEENNSGSITIKKNDLWKYSTFVMVAVVIIGAIVMFTGDKEPSINANVVNNGGTGGTTSKVQATVDDDAVLGDEDAPVTIIEFSDYQCPFCGRFYSQTLPQIKSQNV